VRRSRSVHSLPPKTGGAAHLVRPALSHLRATIRLDIDLAQACSETNAIERFGRLTAALRQQRSFANRLLWTVGSTRPLVLLILANFLNFPCRPRAKRFAPCGDRQLALRRREESHLSQTQRHRGRAPRPQRPTHLPFAPLDGALLTLDGLLAGASAS
jgi:hypothetical protein